MKDELTRRIDAQFAGQLSSAGGLGGVSTNPTVGVNLAGDYAWSGTHNFQFGRLFAPSISPSAGKDMTVPNVASDTFALLNAPQTLTFKTLTQPAIADFTLATHTHLGASTGGLLSMPLGANPSAAAGLAAVNGTAATWMRSDGAPAISQAIAPTWTGLHTFSGGLTAGNAQLISLSRTLPTVVNSTVDIGSFGTAFSHTLRMTIAVNDGGFSVPKSFLLTSNYDNTAGAWRIVPALADGGPFGGNDYQLEANQSTTVLSLRIRRSAGSSAGTAVVSILYESNGTGVFTASTATASGVTVVTAVYPSTPITQVNGRVGINTPAPAAPLDVLGDIAANFSTSPQTITVGIGTTGGLASGQTGRFRFGDVYHQLSVTYGQGMTMTAYHGVEITANPAAGGFVGVATLLVDSQSSNTSGKPILIVRGVSGQTADIFQVQDSTTAVLFSVGAGGGLGVGSFSSSLLPITTETYDLGSATKLWRKGWLSEIDAVMFSQNTIQVIGGWLMVTKNEGLIPVGQDVAIADATIDFGKAMTAGDFVAFRAAGAYEVVSVTSLSAGTRYNVARNLDGSGANAWPAGSVYVVLGQLGDGRIELNSNATPRISIIKQGAAWNTSTTVVQIGDLNGLGGASVETYGFYAGDGTNYIRYDPLTAPNFAIKAGGGNVTIDSTGLALGVGTGNSNSVTWKKGATTVGQMYTRGGVFNIVPGTMQITVTDDAVTNASYSANLTLQALSNDGTITSNIVLDGNAALSRLNIFGLGFTGMVLGGAGSNSPNAMLDVRGNAVLAQAIGTSGSPYALTITGAAHTTLTASAEAVDVNLALARTVQFATGAIARQRAVLITAPTYGFVGASTITDAATLHVQGAPVAGANATLTNPYVAWLTNEATAAVVALDAYGAAASTFANYLARRGRGTLAAPTLVVSGDVLGRFGAQGHDGSIFRGATRIDSVVDAAASAGIVPGRMVFYTASAAGVLTESFRIDSAQKVIMLAGGSWAGSPTLTTPFIADHTNAQHTHLSAAQGGVITTTPAIFAQTAAVTVSTTGAQTLTGAGSGSLTLAANALAAGKTVRLTASGYYTPFNAGNLAFVVKLGAAAVCTITLAMPGTGSQYAWAISALITCRTAGATGTVAGQMIVHSSTPGIALTINTGTSTIDTTGTLAIDLTANWALASQTCTLTNLVVELL